MDKRTQYYLNCFLLLVPILLWNIVFYDALPESYHPAIFDNDIPMSIVISENILRMIVMGLPLIMILSFTETVQKIGLITYSVGVFSYFLSWQLLIQFPDSIWSNSIAGFTAPAYTTLIWFIGIGLIGKEAFFKFKYLSPIYFTGVFLFVTVHTLHAAIVFQRL